jgi:hypothetical protein
MLLLEYQIQFSETRTSFQNLQFHRWPIDKAVSGQCLLGGDHHSGA